MVRDKGLFGHPTIKRTRPPPSLMKSERKNLVQVSFGKVAKRSPEVGAALAEARAARNRQTRLERQAAKTEEVEASRARRRRRRREKEEDLNLFLCRRIHISMEENVRPKIGRSTARKLFHRGTASPLGRIGVADFRGPDGRHSIHFEFTPRGFASWRGRRWRPGEAERAARYITREDGLDGGEHGWWSNVADHRPQLVGFFRTLEALEKHDRKNANVYISEIIALPAELTAKQRRRAVRRICQFFEERSLNYVAAVHLPDRDGDQRNFHCHILYSLRPCKRVDTYDWSFAVVKENDINTPDGIRSRRRQVVRDINTTLCATGIDKRLTELSNPARGMAEAEPTAGQISTAIKRRLTAMESQKALLQKISLFASDARATLHKTSQDLSLLRSAVRYRLERATRLNELKHTILLHNSARTTSMMAAQNPLSHLLQNLREHLRTDLEGNTILLSSQAAEISKKMERHRSALTISQHANRSAVQTAANVTSVRLANVQCKLQVNPADLKHTAVVALSRIRTMYRAVAARAGDNAKRIAIVRDRALDMNALLKKREVLETAEARRVNRDSKLLSSAAQILLKLLEPLQRKIESRRSDPLELDETRVHAREALDAIRNTIASKNHACDQALANARPSKASLSRTGGESPTAAADDRDNGKSPALERHPRATRPNASQSIRARPHTTQETHSSGKASRAHTEIEALRAEIRRRRAIEPGAIDAHPARGSFSKGRERLEELRNVARKHKPPADLVMHRSSPKISNSDEAAEARRHAEMVIDMVRREAKRREKRVREQLLRRARGRLLTLEVGLTLREDGNYTLKRGKMPDDEYFVLMKCNPPDNTQALLNEVGAKQKEAVQIENSPDATKTQPVEQGTERKPARGDQDEWNLTMQRFAAQKSGRPGK